MEEKRENEELEKGKIVKITIALILFIIALVVKFNNQLITNTIYVISYIIIGFEIIKTAINNIFKGKIFDENFLMSVATICNRGISRSRSSNAILSNRRTISRLCSRQIKKINSEIDGYKTRLCKCI